MLEIPSETWIIWWGLLHGGLSGADWTRRYGDLYGIDPGANCYSCQSGFGLRAHRWEYCWKVHTSLLGGLTLTMWLCRRIFLFAWSCNTFKAMVPRRESNAQMQIPTALSLLVASALDSVCVFLSNSDKPKLSGVRSSLLRSSLAGLGASKSYEWLRLCDASILICASILHVFYFIFQSN
jgi:hypothetical protein